mmetsp:Transcript_31652/g.87142  ORF Transcript_31652/g.87142 Transcript_31652/m.87142 type:complete len:208 (+) Transcript_31652:912-1535(+)
MREAQGEAVAAAAATAGLPVNRAVALAALLRIPSAFTRLRGDHAARLLRSTIHLLLADRSFYVAGVKQLLRTGDRLGIVTVPRRIIKTICALSFRPAFRNTCERRIFNRGDGTLPACVRLSLTRTHFATIGAATHVGLVAAMHRLAPGWNTQLCICSWAVPRRHIECGVMWTALACAVGPPQPVHRRLALFAGAARTLRCVGAARTL